jgi:hypothetical protein
MKHFIVILALTALCASAQTPISIDPDRLWTWDPGVNLGVQGGIDQYRPGGVNQRLISAPASKNALDYGADPLGVADSRAAINSAIAATTSGGVAYIPMGVFRLAANGIGVAIGRSDITVRGAGRWVMSDTPAAVELGTKTFTVPENLGYVAGEMAVRVWRHIKPVVWMQGVVTSYVGTQLTLNVTSTSTVSLGETFDDWKVSLTYLDYEYNSAPGISIGANQDYLWPSISTVTGNPQRGSTSITLSDASTISVGNIIRIAVRVKATLDDFLNMTPRASPMISAGGFDYVERQNTRVTAKVGNVLTIEPALIIDVPESSTPRVAKWSNYCTRVGLEDLTIGGTNSTTANGLISMFQTWNSWIYNVESHNNPNYHISTGDTLFSEIRNTWAGWRLGSGTNGSALLVASATSFLVEDGVFFSNFPALQINGSTKGSAFIGLFTDFGEFTGTGSATIITNHSPGNSYNLYEHNKTIQIQSDGYHGGENTSTWFRNKVDRYLVSSRWGYHTTQIGNVVGIENVFNATFSYGNPSFSGTHNGGPPVYANRVEGPIWDEIHPGIYMTVTSVTDTHITATASAGTEAPSTFWVGLWPVHLHSPDTYPIDSRIKTTTNMTVTAVSGATITLSRSSETGGAPAVGDVYRFWGGANAMFELDYTTQDTADERYNYRFFAAGGGTLTSSVPDGQYIKPSLTTRTSAPAAYTSRSIANWPPVDPLNPNMEYITPASLEFYRSTSTGTPTVATPTFSLAAGSHELPASFTISGATADATYYWTNDGTDPDETDNLYTGAISLTEATVTYKVRGYKAEHDPSAIATRIFTGTVTPDPDPEPSATNTTITGDLNATRIQLVVP